MSSPDERFSFTIDIPVRNEWRNIDLLRTSVQNCFNAVFSDIDGCEALSMVTGELLENAMKYGNWSDSDSGSAFRLRVQGTKSHSSVTVENPVDAGARALAELQKTLDWIRSFPTAADAYRARLLEIAQNAELGESKLGLVRVAYEGNCTLDAKVERDRLTVTAQIRM